MLIKKTFLNPHANKHSRKNIIIALCLVAALLVTGAFAYLTDRDQATNTFTVGDVKIDLKEPSWSESNATDIWAGKVMSKDPQVKNTGDNDAFIYVMVTVPKADNLMIFDETKGKAEVNNYQLFTYNLNSPVADPATAGWTLIDSKIDVDDTNNYYLYAYSTALIPGATTIPVFNKITFANVIEDQFTEPNNELNVIVDAYAIQSNFGNNSANAKPEDVWNRYVNQNGWDWPSSPVPPHYSLIGYKGDPIKSTDYASTSDVVKLPNAISPSFDNCEFAGWVDDAGNLYASGAEIQVSTLFIKDENGNILNPNPTFTEIISTFIPSDNTDEKPGLPVKLMPKNDTCTTVIDRGALITNGRLCYDNGFAAYTESNSDVTDEDGNRLYGIPTTNYPYTVADSETFENWFVYGLDEGTTLDELFSSYVRVQGDGYAKVVSTSANMAGTGTLIEVYDRNGTEEITDDILVEKFYVIIFGDLNGDAAITAIDGAIVDSEVAGKTTWHLYDCYDYCLYKVKAADIMNDCYISSVDATLIDRKVAGISTINQVTGLAS